jgi:hypothetical protein
VWKNEEFNGACAIIGFLFACVCLKKTMRQYLTASLRLWLPDPQEDLRHDAHSLQKLKHPLPLLSWWTVRDPSKRHSEGADEEDLLVSCELLAQVLSGSNMTYSSDPKIVFDRITRAATGNQTVGIPRYMVEHSVHNQTAALAWIVWSSQRPKELLDFVRAPQQ